MNTRKPCISRSLKVGITFLILSFFQAKEQKCLSSGAILLSDAVFFDFPINFLKSSLATHYVAFSFLPV